MQIEEQRPRGVIVPKKAASLRKLRRQTTLNNKVRSDEGLTLEKSASFSLRGGNATPLSTCLIPISSVNNSKGRPYTILGQTRFLSREGLCFEKQNHWDFYLHMTMSGTR